MNNLLKKHAKSFYWASFFLSKIVIKKSTILYNFCRTLDDIADENNGLKIKKENFSKFKKDFLDKNFKNPIIREMWLIIDSEKISRKIVLDLFDGVESDLQEKVNLKSKKDLLIYSYKVAGTVGLMMSKILQVKDKEALKGAVDLGIAMQLTNIARDIGEDARNNRIYIPTDWMKRNGIAVDAFLKNPENFPEVSILVKQLLNKADYFYKRAGAGYFSLPKECRPGIFSAGKIYSKIGKHIAASNYDSVSRRAYTTTFEKFLMLISSIGDSALTTVMPIPSTIHAAALPEVNFLVNSVKTPKESKKSFKQRSSKFINLLFDLEQKDRALAGI